LGVSGFFLLRSRRFGTGRTLHRTALDSLACALLANIRETNTTKTNLFI
jgi:hypothetical protein